MSNTPWDRAKSGTEHGEQSALFQWCNMAVLYGVSVANLPNSYSTPGYAKETFETLQVLDKRNIRAAAHVPAPVLGRLFAIHNQGHGDRIRGNRARAEGVKTGVPDVCLPYPVAYDDACSLISGFCKVTATAITFGRTICGLYIELKVREITKPGVRKAEVIARRAGTTSDEQDDWIDYLRRNGYAVAVCYGWEEARDVLLAYLGLRGL